FEAVKTSKTLEWLKKRGARHLQIIPIDNPLAEPFDPVFLGFHLKEQNEVSLLALKKTAGLDKLGGLVLEKNRLRVVEYLHLPGALKCSYFNTGLLIFSLAFLENHTFDLPVYRILKETVFQGRKRKVYKSEQFIFDALEYARKASALACPQGQCFAPLKDRSSLKAIRRFFLQSCDSIYL
ncbi:MAG: UTP--glucose-1-phosphate uridylyltransferase, partial [Parachlamydiales bacterium]